MSASCHFRVACEDDIEAKKKNNHNKDFENNRHRKNGTKWERSSSWALSHPGSP